MYDKILNAVKLLVCLFLIQLILGYVIGNFVAGEYVRLVDLIR